AEYYIIREFLPISEAKAEYPELEAFIDSKATVGGISSVASGVTGGKFQRSGMRQSIERWTWWQRNHPVDMSEDEALATGRVQPAIEEVQEDAVDPETGEPIIDPETGDAVQQTVQVHATTEDGRRVYVLTETGQMVMPGDPEWPKRKVLRQIQFLADKVVFDDVSPFVDIPVGRNKCMMIDESPYAQGEPQRIAGLIDLRNRLFSIWYGYAKRFRSPEQIIPADVFNATRKAVEELHSDASKKWIIPSELWMQYGGDVIRNLEAPQLGPVISHMMDVVGREIDKVSGMTEVIRGETKSDQSGELFRAALEAARGPIGLKARN